MATSGPRSILLVVLIDALRHDYLSPAASPFLHTYRERGYFRRLRPTFGFEPDAAYLAGLYPDEANGGAQYWLDFEASPFRAFRGVPPLLNSLPHGADRLLRKAMAWSAARFAGDRFLGALAPTAQVPLHELHRFAFPYSHPPDWPGFAGGRGLFGILERHKIPFAYLGMPYRAVDSASILQAARRCARPPIRLVFAQIGDLDRVGHRFGPNSDEVRTAVRWIDQRVEETVAVLEQRYDEVQCVIFGDHGMVAVDTHCDVAPILHTLGSTPDTQIMCFVDSTMLRLWVDPPGAVPAIAERLIGAGPWTVLDEAARQYHRVNYSHRKFGDILALADPGVLLHPSFFSRRDAPRGMHGYDPRFPDQQAALVVGGPGIDASEDGEPVDMRRMFPTFLRLLELQHIGPKGIDSLV